MRQTHMELDVLRRGVVHALELALEDAERWAVPLDESMIEVRPAGLPSVGFQLRHMARSLDRLLTYAEDQQLNDYQLAMLNTEGDIEERTATLEEFRTTLITAVSRIAGFAPRHFEEPRGIGRLRLPSTVGGLLIHCAEHTQRHSGQMVTTAKLVTSMQRKG